MDLISSPLLVAALSFLILSLSARAGNSLRFRISPIEEDEQRDFDLVLTAVLTLLGLLIGFGFSMAVTRYDQRKDYEEDEANAIGTEYARADLLPETDAANVHALLKKYVDERVLFYETRDRAQLAGIRRDTAELQNELWSVVRSAVPAQPTPMSALVVSGMNDVLNSQGHTQAAWWNRIPFGAWGLMAAVAVCVNVLIGYRAHRKNWRIFLILPTAISIAFFLISDIDSTRLGIIRVVPQNLISLAQSLQAE